MIDNVDFISQGMFKTLSCLLLKSKKRIDTDLWMVEKEFAQFQFLRIVCVQSMLVIRFLNKFLRLQMRYLRLSIYKYLMAVIKLF